MTMDTSGSTPTCSNTAYNDRDPTTNDLYLETSQTSPDIGKLFARLGDVNGFGDIYAIENSVCYKCHMTTHNPSIPTIDFEVKDWNI